MARSQVRGLELQQSASRGNASESREGVAAAVGTEEHSVLPSVDEQFNGRPSAARRREREWSPAVRRRSVWASVRSPRAKDSKLLRHVDIFHLPTGICPDWLTEQSPYHSPITQGYRPTGVDMCHIRHSLHGSIRAPDVTLIHYI